MAFIEIRGWNRVFLIHFFGYFHFSVYLNPIFSWIVSNWLVGALSVSIECFCFLSEQGENQWKVLFYFLIEL